VLYELHVGSFSPEGTFEGVRQRLPELRGWASPPSSSCPSLRSRASAAGVTTASVLFAPFAGYGTPEQLSELVDAVHSLGMSVNPGRRLVRSPRARRQSVATFSDSYFDKVNANNHWGRAPALGQTAFRRLLCDNARYWLDTFGFDGLRLDATHELDARAVIRTFLNGALSRRARLHASCRADRRRQPQRPKGLIARGIDAVWSDDFHHALHVLLTSEADGYYAAFKGDLAELARVIERGQLFEGQVGADTGQTAWQIEQRRPSPAPGLRAPESRPGRQPRVGPSD